MARSKLFIVPLLFLALTSYAQPTVLLDRYFNSEKKQDSAGKLNYWHYTWEETGDGGFSILGNVFKQHGARLSSLDTAPTKAALGKAAVYIIVDPDHLKDNPTPNYISSSDIATISSWVQNGGTLLLLGNDSANCDLVHLNMLAQKFGVTFTNRKTLGVVNDDFKMGRIEIADHLLFQQRNIFMKDVSVLATKDATAGVLWNKDDLVMTVSSYGKGKVIAVGDPWLYNEYIDHRRLPGEYDNLGAANDLVTFLLNTTPKKKPGN
jgi:unsaturated rhamnogalacturonyl hydrolase